MTKEARSYLFDTRFERDLVLGSPVLALLMKATGGYSKPPTIGEHFSNAQAGSCGVCEIAEWSSRDQKASFGNRAP